MGRLNHSGVPASQFPDKKGEWFSLCPFHADTKPTNFSVSEHGYNCFACGNKGGLRKLAKHLGIDLRRHRDMSGCTMAAYADLKRLAPGLLKKWGVSDALYRNKPELHMKYWDENGDTVRVKRRLRLEKDGDSLRFVWAKGVGDGQLHLYGLWQMKKIRAKGWVMLVEGESDCHTAWTYDLPCLGVPGANTWKGAWASKLDGLDVFLWKEPDAGGTAFVRTVSKSLPNVKVLTPGPKDISEAHCSGLDVVALVEEAKARAKTARVDLEESSAATLMGGLTSRHETDLGNAQRLVARHGGDMLYCDALGGWLVWDGKRWAVDDTGKVERFAKETVLSIYAEAEQQKDSDMHTKLSKHAADSESARAIRDMIKLARTEADMMVRASDFDGDPWLLNCTNGTLDLRTGRLRDHDRADMITKLATVAFDPDAKSDNLDRYLDTVTSGNAEFSAYLQRACGYSLTGDTREECFFLMLGPASTGKSTLVEAMLSMLGDYGIKSNFAAFLQSRNAGGATPELVRLRGARFVAAVETAKGAMLNEALVKELTGGDSVTARALYHAPITFKPEFKLWLAANESPKLTDTDTGIWRRLQRLPFEHELTAAERDPLVKASLCAEDGPALLAWVVRGCLAWQRDRLGQCDIVEAKTHALRADFDPLAEFFDGWCVFAHNAEALASDLRAAYEAWANGAGARPINSREWGKRLKAQGCESKQARRHGQRASYWFGVGLRSDDDPEPDGRGQGLLEESPVSAKPLRVTLDESEYLDESGAMAARNDLDESDDLDEDDYLF